MDVSSDHGWARGGGGGPQITYQWIIPSASTACQALNQTLGKQRDTKLNTTPGLL